MVSNLAPLLALTAILSADAMAELISPQYAVGPGCLSGGPTMRPFRNEEERQRFLDYYRAWEEECRRQGVRIPGPFHGGPDSARPPLQPPRTEVPAQPSVFPPTPGVELRPRNNR